METPLTTALIAVSSALLATLVTVLIYTFNIKDKIAESLGAVTSRLSVNESDIKAIVANVREMSANMAKLPTAIPPNCSFHLETSGQVKVNTERLDKVERWIERFEGRRDND